MLVLDDGLPESKVLLGGFLLEGNELFLDLRVLVLWFGVHFEFLSVEFLLQLLDLALEFGLDSLGVADLVAAEGEFLIKRPQFLLVIIDDVVHVELVLGCQGSVSRLEIFYRGLALLELPL